MKEQIEKQAIEEMAKVIEKTEQIARDAHCGLPSPTMYANDLYWHGYRKQEWISVDDRLPEYGGMYLVYNPQRMVSKVVTARYSKDPNRWCSADACCYHEGITHWMPLPEAPKMKGD